MELQRLRSPEVARSGRAPRRPEVFPQGDRLDVASLHGRLERGTGVVLIIVVGVGVWLALLGLAVVLCRAASLGDGTDDRRAALAVAAAVAGQRDHERARDRRALAQLPRSKAR
jgi:hypothetical protein